MEFLKRHYEKLILLALSVISLLAVLYMTSVLRDTKEVTDRDLKIPTRSPDYKTLDSELAKYKAEKSAEERGNYSDAVKLYAGSDKYKADELIRQTPLKWPASSYRSDAGRGHFSDLVSVFKMARCPHCNRVIPFSYFSDSKCPCCGGELKKPSGRPRRLLVFQEGDSDGDGINDDDERRFGLDPNDPGDALLDADNDGFSNLFEVQSNTEPRNSNSCPPLWYRLRFRGMDRIELPIRLTSVDTGGKSDPKNWDALIKLQRRNARGRLISSDDSYRIGDELNFDGRNYRVADMKQERRVEKTEGGLEKNIDSYVVTLREVRPEGAPSDGKPLDELKLVLGQPTYSPDRRVLLEDIGFPPDANGKRPVYGLREGATFVVGNTGPAGRNVVPMTYRLVKFDERNKTALLEFARGRAGADRSLDVNGRRMLVTEFSEIPEDVWAASPQAGSDGRASRNRNRNRETDSEI